MSKWEPDIQPMPKPRFVDVTPLQPPFDLSNTVYFNLGDETLAVSVRDGKNLRKLLGGDGVGLMITMSPMDDPNETRIRVSVDYQS